MRQGRRDGLSAAQRTEIWRRWKAGESLHEIGTSGTFTPSMRDRIRCGGGVDVLVRVPVVPIVQFGAVVRHVAIEQVNPCVGSDEPIPQALVLAEDMVLLHLVGRPAPLR